MYVLNSLINSNVSESISDYQKPWYRNFTDPEMHCISRINESSHLRMPITETAFETLILSQKMTDIKTEGALSILVVIIGALEKLKPTLILCHVV